MKGCWFLGLTLAAWEDFRSRRVSCWLLLVLLAPGIWNMYSSDLAGHLSAALTGVSMLLLSKVTRGALGEGDGWFFLLSACYLDAGEITVLFLGSLGISCVWGMVLLMGGCLGQTRRMSYETIPFLTCAWPVGACLLWQ